MCIDHAFGKFGLDRHDAQHQLWSISLRVPKNISWDFGDVAVVTGQSSVEWRQGGAGTQA